MTFNQLRTFLEVARHGSVSGAAAALVVTEPSVSAAIAALQKEFDVALVERDGRGIRVTAAGRALASYAAQIIGLADQAQGAVREAAGGAGALRVVTVTTAGEYVVPPLLAAFRERRPEVAIHLEVGNRADALARLIERQADVGIGGRPPQTYPITGEPFLDNQLVVVARPDHPLAGRSSVDARELSSETWLMREEGSGTRETTIEFLLANEVDPPSTMVVGSNGAMKQAAAVGLGVTLMSLDAVAPDLASGQLARLPVTGTPLDRAWYVLYRDDARFPSAGRAFLELLRSPTARRVVRGDGLAGAKTPAWRRKPPSAPDPAGAA